MHVGYASVQEVLAMSTTTRSSHAAGAQVALTDQVAAVKELLGPKLAGFTFGVSLTTVDRWASGKVSPGLDRERRVRAAYQILELLRPVEAAPTIRAWFIGMNPQLDDRAPAEAIAVGDLRETLAAARAFAAGG